MQLSLRNSGLQCLLTDLPDEWMRLEVVEEELGAESEAPVVPEAPDAPDGGGGGAWAESEAPVVPKAPDAPDGWWRRSLLLMLFGVQHVPCVILLPNMRWKQNFFMSE
ncbi:hypothetical protein Tco_1066876 [Tanacetum coccineum]|uniref:Uncharacterized protein n=1 Tax=Tanacetum coccineum TaxID=301880 RepID=A0ABQ5HC55_9ASTR